MMENVRSILGLAYGKPTSGRDDLNAKEVRKSPKILKLKGMTQGSNEMRNLCGIITRDNDINNIEQQVNGSMIIVINEQGRICQGIYKTKMKKLRREAIKPGLWSLFKSI